MVMKWGWGQGVCVCVSGLKEGEYPPLTPPEREGSVSDTEHIAYLSSQRQKPLFPVLYFTQKVKTSIHKAYTVCQGLASVLYGGGILSFCFAK